MNSSSLYFNSTRHFSVKARPRASVLVSQKGVYTQHKDVRLWTEEPLKTERISFTRVSSSGRRGADSGLSAEFGSPRPARQRSDRCRIP